MSSKSIRHIFIASSSFNDADASFLQLIQENGYSFNINKSGKRLNQQELIIQAKDADAVIAGLEIYDELVLKQLPRLKCISRCGVGTDNIDLRFALHNGIKICTTPDAVVQPVAELTLLLILDLLRHVTQHATLMNVYKWERLIGRQLAGKTIGVIGLGRIGRRVSELMIALGANVIGYDIRPDEFWSNQKGVSLAGLDQILSTADVLTLHLALDSESPFVLTEKHFRSMKAGALIINVARGAFLDEDALVSALQQGYIAGAALDVFNREPYQGPLCGMPNVILTPHVGTFTREARAQMEFEAVENIISFLRET